MNIQHADDKFCTNIDGMKCELIYNVYENKMDIYHLFTPPELRGRGISEKLVLAAFEFAKQHNLKVVPSCSYIKEVFLKNHKEFNEMIEE